ncbi:unnamed protein product [Notodromas monacha]|uniref:Uncharacterized protein n=1 Tax=Notodromas monacha TaxID=399045 RepID=A0A7R9BQG1_9CRUS|nr:unnamed protein product [Notodromas monacha]CAG0919785.1 unnamed protein product [Notodromas monacha]
MASETGSSLFAHVLLDLFDQVHAGQQPDSDLPRVQIAVDSAARRGRKYSSTVVEDNKNLVEQEA